MSMFCMFRSADETTIRADVADSAADDGIERDGPLFVPFCIRTDIPLPIVIGDDREVLFSSENVGCEISSVRTIFHATSIVEQGRDAIPHFSSICPVSVSTNTSFAVGRAGVFPVKGEGVRAIPLSESVGSMVSMRIDI
ncbi:hypothetical protein BLNAU_15353 [Blattamonas nauphoetae]|uniref:Uncharacterized protein n=1 Tax=Blattamonas nauphoetae TaxID=2049346 RepID=A0ABQ9XED1_9EUKA|nr:hypothetical protein BLNAU_15353 [Blattamonas nauphoetae]